MSRSYRSPYIKDGYGSKWKKVAKRSANRAVRRADVADGGEFRKHYNSWDICDYVFHMPEDPKFRRK